MLCKIPVNFRQNSFLSKSGKIHSALNFAVKKISHKDLLILFLPLFEIVTFLSLMQKICNYLSCHWSKTLWTHLLFNEDIRILLTLEVGRSQWNPKEKAELFMGFQQRIKIIRNAIFSPRPSYDCGCVCVEHWVKKWRQWLKLLCNPQTEGNMPNYFLALSEASGVLYVAYFSFLIHLVMTCVSLTRILRLYVLRTESGNMYFLTNKLKKKQRNSGKKNTLYILSESQAILATDVCCIHFGEV